MIVIAVQSRLPIKRIHANVKTIKLMRVCMNGAKTNALNDRTIVETERNVNFLLTATVGRAATT